MPRGNCRLGARLAAIVVGVLLGSRHLKSPGWLSLALAAAGAAVGGIVLLAAARRRSAEHRTWLPALLGAAALGVGVLAMGYVGFLRPWRLLRSEVFYYNADDAEMRQLCHLTMLWCPSPHDQFLHLIDAGDRSSIPHILWAMRDMPPPGKPAACTWGHGLAALRHITNNSVGYTREDWVRWYETNRHCSTMQWWADGFKAEGFDVAADGSGDSIRHLLAAMGRTPWCLDDPKRWLSRNAMRMLARQDRERVRAAMADVLRTGTVGERRGLARYAGGMPEYDLPPLARKEAEPMLRPLLADADDSVRLYASGVLCERQIKWLRNPEGWLIRRYEPGEVDEEEFFCPSDRSFTVGRDAWTFSDYEVTQGDPPAIRIVDAEPGDPNSAEAEFVGSLLLVPTEPGSDDEVTVVFQAKSTDDRQPASGVELAKATGLDVDDLCWLYLRESGRLYVSTPRTTYALDTATGKVLWRMGYGGDDFYGFHVFGNYIFIHQFPGFVICDARHGGIMAVVAPEDQDRCFGNRLILVDGRLHAIDDDDRLYVIAMPVLPEADTP